MRCARFRSASARRCSKCSLDLFAAEVQRFFPIPKGSPAEAFRDLAPRYPVFELLPLDANAQARWFLLGTMLEMRSNFESCVRVLLRHSLQAMICTFECTFGS